MEQVKNLLLALFLIPSLTFGVCPNKVQPIKQGDVAVCDGYLFSDEAEKSAAQSRDDATFYKELNIRLAKKIELEQKEVLILEDRLNNYMVAASTLSKELGQKKTTDGFVNVFYFTLGAVITGYIAANVR